MEVDGYTEDEAERGVEPPYDEEDEDDDDTGVSETELRWPADGVPAIVEAAPAPEAPEALPAVDGSGLDDDGIGTGVLGYSEGLTVAAICRNLALLRYFQKELIDDGETK